MDSIILNNGSISNNGTSTIPTITITDPSGVSHQETNIASQSDCLFAPPLGPPPTFAHIRELANSADFLSLFSNNGIFSNNAERVYMIDFESYVLAVSNWRRGRGQFLGEHSPDLADYVKLSRGCGCESRPNLPSPHIGIDFARYIQAVVNWRDRHASYEERPNLADHVMIHIEPIQPPTFLPLDFSELDTRHRLWQWMPSAPTPAPAPAPVSSTPSTSLGIPPPVRNDDVITPNLMRMSVLSNSLLSTSNLVEKY